MVSVLSRAAILMASGLACSMSMISLLSQNLLSSTLLRCRLAMIYVPPFVPSPTLETLGRFGPNVRESRLKRIREATRAEGPRARGRRGGGTAGGLGHAR
jgi:hypothetical protein